MSSIQTNKTLERDVEIRNIAREIQLNQNAEREKENEEEYNLK